VDEKISSVSGAPGIGCSPCCPSLSENRDFITRPNTIAKSIAIGSQLTVFSLPKIARKTSDFD